jgi:type IV pilus assembly protein PilB
MVQKGKGCNICNGTGYKGRIGVFELMPVTPEIQTLVTDKASTQNIRDCAISQGMLTLKQAGIELVRDGKSTVEEVRTAVG